jgi:uncharacterized protein YigE (DUF2233 family)
LTVSTRILLVTVLVAAALAGALFWWWRTPVPAPRPEPGPERPVELPAPCRELAFEAANYIVCEIDTALHDVVLRRADAGGKAYGSLAALAKTEPFMLAMNAGMYHEDRSPVGLHIEDGVVRSPLNLDDAPGNFFMKPNGVFYVGTDGSAGVMETSAFAAAGIEPVLATQSGPMLVIDGKMHPRFEENGASRYIRNAVGADGGSRVVLAISRLPVSLGSFSRLFSNELGIRNALFFDGAISALHNGNKYLVGGAHPVGPILAVRERPNR